MKKMIYLGLLTIGLVVGLTSPAFAAQTGLYVGNSYYSTSYLGTLSVSKRVEILQATTLSPLTSFVVIGTKYSKFSEYNGISSLKVGADAAVPAQVNDVSTGSLVDSQTGIAVGVTGDPFEVTSID